MKIYKATLNLSKIIKENIFESKSGDKWLSFDIIVNDSEDKYDNIGALKQWNKIEKKSEFFGSIKEFKKENYTQKPKESSNDGLPF